MERLLAAGADLHRAASDNFTPLHFAAMKGHLAVVEALVPLPVFRAFRARRGERHRILKRDLN